jgi:hypothetical protein
VLGRSKIARVRHALHGWVYNWVESCDGKETRAMSTIEALIRDLSNDPLLAALLKAPVDDEQITDDDIAAEAAADADISARRLCSHRKARRILLGTK